MALMDIGKHCSLDSCKRIDFLPFVCLGCKEVFCKDHNTYESHSCSFQKNPVIPKCPLCDQLVPKKVTTSADEAIHYHIENNCVLPDNKKLSRNCSMKKCQNRELIEIICRECQKNFCLKHRYREDHKCVGLASSLSTILKESNNSGAHKGPKPKTQTPSRAPAPSSTAPKPSDNSRGGTFNQSSHAISLSHLQGNMSEMEALNLALANSLSTANDAPAEQDAAEALSQYYNRNGPQTRNQGSNPNFSCRLS